jgi:hypothetical protein
LLYSYEEIDNPVKVLILTAYAKYFAINAMGLT